MRVYLPATTSHLQELLDSGALGTPPITGFAVTAGLRQWYVDDDLEELEYAAAADAARASLRLIDADPSAARRRVVVAADIQDSEVTVHDDIDLGVIRVQTRVQLGQIASLHVDDAEAETSVGAAATAVLAADLGDATAQEAVDDVEGYELSWYASQEIGALLALL